jgi:hydroxymethylglutaryl-CoA reductase (NADPH)
MGAGILWVEDHVGSFYVELAEAEETDGAPGKYVKGLGGAQMSVVDAREETTSLALTAAARLLRASGVSPGEIGRIDAATESGPDAMKGLATGVAALLGRDSAVETTTHHAACHGGAAALFSAVAWLQSEAANGRKALVVAADVAEYAPGTPAWATGGAGAVALLLGPRAPLVLEPFRASETRHLYDVFRPHEAPFPTVDSTLSVQSYLGGLQRLAASFDLAEYAGVLVHPPYARLAEKAHQLLLALEHGKEPLEVYGPGGGAGFATRVEPSLAIARAAGNLWSAALLGALCSRLALAPPEVGERWLLYSYGSGATGAVFTLRATGPVKGPSAATLRERLAMRRAVACAAAREPAPRDFRDINGEHSLPLPCGAYWRCGPYAAGPLPRYYAVTGAAPEEAEGSEPALAADGAEPAKPSAELARVLRERAFGSGRWLSAEEQAALRGLPLRGCLDYAALRGRCAEAVVGCVALPVSLAGPFRLNGAHCHVPLATLEGALVASVRRGAKALAEGVIAVVLGRAARRAPVFVCPSVRVAAAAAAWLATDAGREALAAAVAATSAHTRLVGAEGHVVGRYLHALLSCTTGAAMGMNMVTLAANAAAAAIEAEFPGCELVAVSGNLCSDKKATPAVFRGRGTSVVAEARLSAEAVKGVLRTCAADLARVSRAKATGSAAAGGSAGAANAAAANVVAAFYLATGQDVASLAADAACCTLIEEEPAGAIHASVTLPALELGVIGGGTHLGPQAAGRSLALAGAPPGEDEVEWLAKCLGAAVLAHEVSLLAALATGDLASAHHRLNRAPAPDVAPCAVPRPLPRVPRQAVDGPEAPAGRPPGLWPGRG